MNRSPAMSLRKAGAHSSYTMRAVGHSRSCYDPNTWLLSNNMYQFGHTLNFVLSATAVKSANLAQRYPHLQNAADARSFMSTDVLTQLDGAFHILAAPFVAIVAHNNHERDGANAVRAILEHDIQRAAYAFSMRSLTAQHVTFFVADGLVAVQPVGCTATLLCHSVRVDTYKSGFKGMPVIDSSGCILLPVRSIDKMLAAVMIGKYNYCACCFRPREDATSVICTECRKLDACVVKWFLPLFHDIGQPPKSHPTTPSDVFRELPQMDFVTLGHQQAINDAKYARVLGGLPQHLDLLAEMRAKAAILVPPKPRINTKLMLELCFPRSRLTINTKGYNDFFARGLAIIREVFIQNNNLSDHIYAVENRSDPSALWKFFYASFIVEDVVDIFDSFNL